MTNNKSRSALVQGSFIAYRPATLVELPAAERPASRILRDGPAVCNTAELLQALIGGSKAESIARELIGRYVTLGAISHAPVIELTQIAHGLGEKSAIRLKAALELGRRALVPIPDERPQITTPSDAAQLLMVEMSSLEQEEVRTLLLDTRNRVICAPMLYRGSLSSCGVRIGEMFKAAIRHNAAALIIAHNHPSGDASPSAEDVKLTTNLVKAGKLLDCEVVDHIVIGKNWVSLKERGLGFNDA